MRDLQYVLLYLLVGPKTGTRLAGFTRQFLVEVHLVDVNRDDLEGGVAEDDCKQQNKKASDAPLAFLISKHCSPQKNSAQRGPRPQTKVIRHSSFVIRHSTFVIRHSSVLHFKHSQESFLW